MFDYLKKYAIFIALLGIAFIAAGAINWQRMVVEDANHSVEMVYDYGHVTQLAASEGKTVDEALALFRKAGVTSFAVYDATVEKLVDTGYVKIVSQLSTEDKARLGLTPEAIVMTATGKPGANERLQEASEDLILRLPQGAVTKVTSPDGKFMLAVKDIDENALNQMNLGISSAEIKDIQNRGFGVVVRPKNYTAMTKAKADHFLTRLDANEPVRAIIFVGQEAFGYPDQMDYIGEGLKARDIPVALLESPTQLQFEKQLGAVDMVKHLDYYGVRAYSMFRDELVKLSAEEASQRHFISDTERNIRLNLFSTYKRPIPGKTLLESDASYIALTAEKLQAHGYTLGKASIMPHFHESRALQLLVLLGVGALTGAAFCALTGARRKIGYGLALLTFIGLGTLLFTHWQILARQVAGLLIAVTTPTVAMHGVFRYWQQVDWHEMESRWSLFGKAIVQLALVSLFSLLGGWLLSAILAATPFFMEMEIFRGVKAAFLLPVICVAILYLRIFPTFRTHAYENWQDFPDFAARFLHLPVRVGTLMLAGFIGIAGLIFIGRSGHEEGVPVSQLEISLRRFLESTLAVRPRSKEFLIGHPAFLLVPLASVKRWPQWLHFLLVIAAGIGQASIVETFAHMRSPLWMSTLRGVNGVLIGILVGVIVILGTYVLSALNGYRSRANEEA
ncbi:DUF5693 family protein [Negativicoccus succinicivorans]|uniref:DUF5693 family protein n=1 Tax=Negativicoccus succinicivorans TaxID=620903 RepID=UPI002903ED5D|nr:DUF5693 family protein [Negativicoccus succinicivorans]MDU2929677.1 DUF5693 family protein [Negativicoccus succinicivorans]